MESTSIGNGIHGSADLETLRLKIDPEKLKTLEELPDGRYKEWTEEEDAILLLYGGKKQWKPLAKAMGLQDHTIRKRYQKLMEEQDEGEC